ncbi:CoA transferase [Sulfobacillus acidophilus]|uniref:CoA transferase n=1 Tax=Sulfobacillus acidophilus TaxID=53633 RepID=A0ABS3AYX8_9FIRM|nr:CoA transferase [Sulfobacillus acidophilus]
MTSLPLENIRIIDLSRLLPGPLATVMLQDMGAEVIKVEEPNGGDHLRQMPPLLKDGTNALFHTLNRGKKSVTLDLKNETDKEKLLKLLKSANVLVESFRPGFLKSIGLDPKDLQKKYPYLIICSITGFGQKGEHAHQVGHDLNFIAQAGILGHMANPGVPPVPMADLAGGTWPAVTQILAAIIKQQKAGEGCHIDISMTKGAANLMILQWAIKAAKESVKSANSELFQAKAPCYNVYATKNGHIAIAALENKFWNILVEALNLSHLKDKGLSPNQDGEKVRKELQQNLLQKTTEECINLFQPLNVCVEPVLDEENAISPSLIDIEIANETLKLPIIKFCDQLSSVKSQKAPKLGQDNDDLFK